MLILFLFINLYLVNVNTLLLDCIEPPMECPNGNITFWLYTRQNQDNPHQIAVNDSESITSAPWVEDAVIKIIIHGYTGYKDFAPNTELRPAYMKCCNYNLISVDYNPLAREPCYISAAKNTRLVGMCTGQLIDVLVQEYGFQLSQFHVVGFSLGAHVAGFTGNHVKSGELDRITALDPALPLFVTTHNDSKVDSSDAKFVDVYHTNALEKGKLEATGHVDTYFNGGSFQPGCMATEFQTESSCNHERAPVYFAESINTDIGFYAKPCYSWIMYMIGWCPITKASDEILIGEYIKNTTRGKYFVETNSEEPFAQGRSNDTKSTTSNETSQDSY